MAENTNVWSKFDKEFDTASLAAEVEEVAKNGSTFEKLDPGVYEVKVDRIELMESQKGDPMAHISFKVVSGECKGKCIYMYQVITRGFQIHIVNDMLRSLSSGVDVVFSSFRQYNNLFMDIMEAIDGKYEYALNYGRNKTSKGEFDTFEIEEVFELE